MGLRFKKFQSSPPNAEILSKVTDTKTRQEFQVVQMEKDHIGLVFASDDIVRVPMDFFFMIARGIRLAENRLLRV